MEKPLVSVIIPAYNHEKYVAEAMNSVLNQTYENLELIISDDGSTDNTAEVIRSFKDKRIKAFFLEKNGGLKINCDNLYKHINGKYLACFASDDFWDVTKLEKQIDLMQNSDIGAVFTYTNIINEDGLIIQDEHLSRLFNQPRAHKEIVRHFFYNANCLAAPSFCGISSVVLPLFRAGNYLIQLQDFELWISLAKKTKFHILPEKLLYYRRRANNANLSAETAENGLRTLNETLIILRDFFTDMPETLFYEAFSDNLIKKGKLNQNEILCEQALLFLNHKNLSLTGKMLAAEKIHRLSQNPETLSVLINEYGYNAKDFRQLLVSYKLAKSDF